MAHPPHPESVSGGKNPQEVHAQNDETLLRIPLPLSIKKDFLGENTWATIKENANERHLKVSIRSLRNSKHKSGQAAELGVNQQINIMKLNPGEPIPLAETLGFYEAIMDMFEVLGLQVNDPLVEEERHDDTMGKVEVYMHGRLVEMTGSASSPPQVTAFTRPLVDASARVEIFFRPEPFVYTRWHKQCVLRENDGRARLRSRSRRRRSDDAPALGAEQEAQPAAPAAGQTAEGEAPASGVSGAPEIKEEGDAPMGGVSPTMGGVSPTQAQPIQDEKPMSAISVDVESADYGEEELETARLFEEAVFQLSEAARVSARRATEHLQSPDSNFLVTVENATRSNCVDALVAGSDLRIVMCLATYCRTSQLKAALPINLASSWGSATR